MPIITMYVPISMHQTIKIKINVQNLINIQTKNRYQKISGKQLIMILMYHLQHVLVFDDEEEEDQN